MSNCDKVKLSELIIQKTDTEQIVDMENEHYITLSLYGKGARERVIKDGKYPVPFTGYRVSEGQFIYSRIDARNGAYAIIGPELDGFVVSKDFPVFDINESKVLPHFLRRAVLSDAFINQVKNSSFGATNRMRIKEDIFEGYSIPLPGLSKQQEIVDILDRVETILNSRQQELEKLDALVKARFIELFGDPKQNPLGWEMSTVGDVVASCEAGWSGNGTQREKRKGEIAVLKVSAVTKGYFIPEECKVLDDQESIKKYVYPQAGDLLFSRANTREMVGATAVITEDYPEHILPDKLWKIRFLDKANVWYMKYVLSSESIRSIFSTVSTGTSGSMFNVSMDKFKSIKIPLPPLEIQQKFANFVVRTDKSKSAVQKSLDETQVLFGSLMQKYFG